MPHDPASFPASMKDYLAVVQPDAIMARLNSEHWAGGLYMRLISPHLSRQLLRTSISANQVTGAMIITGIATAAALLVPGIWGPALALLGGQFQLLLDCADGEVARWRCKTSPAGIFLDAVGHYSAEGLIPLALGLRAAGLFTGELEWEWAALGGLLSTLLLFNKALNEMVQVARAKYGLPALKDSSELRTPTNTKIGQLRRLANLLPVQRLFHWIELTMMCFAAGLVGLGIGQVLAARWLLTVLAVLAGLTVIGHLVAILASSKLKVPQP